MPIRQMVHDALADARETVAEVVQDMRQDNQLTDDELLGRYETQRGNPMRVLRFVQQETGLSGDALLDEAVTYEREMEGLWRRRT